MIGSEFLITSLIVVLIPGTGVLFTVSTGLFLGWRASIFAAIGCTAGIIPHLMASIMGLAAIFHTSAVAFHFLKLVGVVYLLYLAWTMWRKKGMIMLDKPSTETGARHIIVRAFLLNSLNPKLSIFFLAFLPQFVAPGTESPLFQMLTLSGVFMGMTLGVFIVYGILANGIRAWVLDSPRLLTWLQRSFAAAFAALGANLAVSER